MTDNITQSEKDFILCAVYTSKKSDETYIFVDQKEGMAPVPEELLARFPEPRLVTTFKLSPDRKLARAEAPKVLASIREQGFYLQMPPPKDAHLQTIGDRNDLLPRQ